MPTIQELDRRIADRLRAASDPLFGSMARGTPRRGSDADIAVVAAGDAWVAAEAVASEICTSLGLKGDIVHFDDLAGPVRDAALAEGIRCG
ncbi:nucleotidyltransferase family protein [Roseomonas sp. AR75]|uniref:nucleotidyltransferase family protein n=1 Tax=Roseomonas sp. AR75 TaxID=2562311 RepID=UPI0010C06295|nr:nucleotidyltransferase domain-containing protein [Roseomonas sp. AR75]